MYDFFRNPATLKYKDADMQRVYPMRLDPKVFVATEAKVIRSGKGMAMITRYITRANAEENYDEDVGIFHPATMAARGLPHIFAI